MDRLQPGKFYHIFHRGIKRGNIFKEDKNYGFFYRRFLYYTKEYFDIYAYCLMSNHYHFVIRVNDLPSLYASDSLALQPHEKAFKNFLISYSKSFNKLYGRKGSVFHPKFKRNHIHDDDYLRNAIIYAHLNPVKHRVFKDFENYKYSSYQTILQGSSQMVKYEEVLKLFDGKRNFIDLHQQAARRIDKIDNSFEKD